MTTRGQNTPPPSPPTSLPSKHIFTLNTKVESLIGSKADQVGTREFPAGRRLYLQFPKGTVTWAEGASTDPNEPWCTATIVTSGDWALLRKDDVLVLDARFSIATNENEQPPTESPPREPPPEKRPPAVMAVQMAARASLKQGPEGKCPRSAVPITATFRFEVSGPATYKDSIVSDRYKRAAANSEKYRSLGRGVFGGTGCVELQSASDDKLMTVSHLTIHGYEIA